MTLPRKLAPLFATCGFLSIAPLGWGADRANSLEEIIVTANKRESSLMETSASISAFDSATLNELGIDGSQDLTARTPSLSITTFTVSIRGVGRPNLAVGSDPGIGIYWDGVYNTENGVFNYNQFFDIERIEVLRGPQGILYGRNSVGGAVSFISKRPAEEFGGTATVELGNYDSIVAQVLASGPVTDELGVLVGVSQITHDGYQKNIYNGNDYEQDDTLYGTVGLQFDPTDNWSTNLKLVGVNQNYRPTNGYILEPFERELVQQVQDIDTGESLNFPGMFPKQNFVNMRQGLAIENPALQDENKVKQDRNPSLDSTRYAAFLNSEYNADSYSLKYTGGYSKYNFDTTQDADASVAADSGVDWNELLFFGVPASITSGLGYGITPADMTYVINQEARFDSHELQYTSEWDSDFSLLGGLYYYHSDEEQVVSYREYNDQLMQMYSYFAGFINKPVSDDNYLFRGDAHVDTRSYASYGQLEWDWTQETKLTAGLRYSYDDKSGRDNTFVQFVGDPDDPTVYRNQSDHWDKWTWRLGIDHFLTQEHFLYGYIATGYRSGGFNFQKPTSSPEVDVVKPEEILSYEVGYKGTMLDNRLNVSSSIYYYDYQNLQVIKQDVVEGIGLNTFVNADKARAMGFELEVLALPVPEVMLSATYSYNNTEYDEFFTKDANACTLGPLAQGNSQAPLCQDEQDLNGNEFALTPENKVSLNATYFWEMFSLDWSATASYIYTGEQWMTPFNDPLYDEVSSWDRWDARLNAATHDGVWEVTAFIKNIADDREVITRGRPSTVTQNAVTVLTDPQVYGLRVSYNF
ncbi:MAG: TonB-dependent receptor [Halioglobus sp.]